MSKSDGLCHSLVNNILGIFQTDAAKFLSAAQLLIVTNERR